MEKSSSVQTTPESAAAAAADWGAAPVAGPAPGGPDAKPSWPEAGPVPGAPVGGTVHRVNV